MPKENTINWKQLIIYLGIFILVLIFWKTPFVYPIKIFVVLLHELGHGLAAMLTGGKMVKIEISHLQGGACWSTGGWRWVVLPAGYLGSMLFGGIILLSAAKTKADKMISIMLGGIVVFITLFFIRNVFGFIFGLLFGCAMTAMGIFIPRFINDYILKFIGITSILYALLDINVDLIKNTIQGSDAWAMSKEVFPLPPKVWGVIWIITAIAAAIFFIKLAVSTKNSGIPKDNDDSPDIKTNIDF